MKVPSAIAVWAAVLWGWFTVEQLTRLILARVGGETAALEAVTWHPVRGGMYALWIASLLWFGWMLRPRKRRYVTSSG